MLRPARVCSTFGVSERIRVPVPAARTRTADSPCDVKRTSSLLAARRYKHSCVGVPPSVQRVIIRMVAAKEVHRPTLAWSPGCRQHARFGNEHRDGQ
jgi:hypothetical protein